MIEFDTLDEAKRAKDTLNGADIYSGCCTLKIEYAKVSDNWMKSASIPGSIPIKEQRKRPMRLNAENSPFIKDTLIIWNTNTSPSSWDGLD